MKKIPIIPILLLIAQLTFGQTLKTIKVQGSNPVTSIGSGYGLLSTPNPITSTGTIVVDSAVLSLKYLKITDTANIRLRPIAGTGVTITGAYPNLTFNSTATGSGTVTSVAKGYGIVTDGTITTSGTITVDSAALSLKYIRLKDSAVTYVTPYQSSLKQNQLTLTTTGSSGAATLTGATLNIPNYAGSGSSGWSLTGNSGIDTSINFAGTTDSKAYVIKTKNKIRAVFDTAGLVKFGLSNYNTNNDKFSIPSINNVSFNGGGIFIFDPIGNNPIGSIQGLNTGTNTQLFLGVNKYYSGSAWVDDGNARVGSSFTIADNTFQFNTFNTGITQTYGFGYNSSGYFGIGTTGGAGPISKLDVRQSSSSTQIRYGDPTGSDIYTYTIGRGTSVGYSVFAPGAGNPSPGFEFLNGALSVGNTAETTIPASAIFEVKNTTKGSISAPIMTASQRNAITGNIVTSNIFTAGTGGTNGTYTTVVLTGGAGSGATATIIVSGGAVTSVTLVNKGIGYNISDTLSSSSIGGVTGFQYLVSSITGTPGLQTYVSDQNVNSTFNGKNWQGGIVTSSASTLTLLAGQDYVFTGSTSTWTLPTPSASIIGRQNAISITNLGSGAITVSSFTGSQVIDIGTVTATTTISVASGASTMLMPFGTGFKALYKQ